MSAGANHDAKRMCEPGSCTYCDEMRSDPVVARFISGETPTRQKPNALTMYSGLDTRGSQKQAAAVGKPRSSKASRRSDRRMAVAGSCPYCRRRFTSNGLQMHLSRNATCRAAHAGAPR